MKNLALALALALPLAELGFGDHAPPIAWTPIVALFALIAVDPHAARAAPPGQANSTEFRRPLPSAQLAAQG